MNRLIVKLKRSKRGTIVNLAAMLMLAAMGGAGGLLTRDVAAENIDITADIKPTLQVLLPAENILLNLSPEYNLEAFASQDFKIMVGTNSITGYNLSLTAASTDLTRTERGQDGTYATIPTLAALAGGYTEESFTVNHWGYKNTTNDANANYIPFSTNISLANNSKPTNGDEIDLNFAAKVDLEQPSGTYKLSLNFQATTNVVLGIENIIFDGNGASNPDAMAVQTISAPGANLNMNQFVRDDGLVFMGWNTQADGKGTDYADQANYTVSSTQEMKSTILYAQWGDLSMQTYTKDRCSSEAVAAPVTLRDLRDDKEYTVRYINGICTMTQNLDFELVSGMTLTPATTNVTTNRTLATVGALDTGGSAANSYDEPRTAKNTAVANSGIHYNYAAATAGTITGSSNTTPATEDICPKGWRLPTGGQGEEQFILNNSYTWQQYNANYPKEFSPVAAGNYYYGSLGSSGSRGYWWSSTAYSTASRYYLVYNTSNGLRSGNGNSRDYGFSVRCVLGS